VPAPVESLTVWSREVEPLDDRQGELFDTAQVDEAALGDLLERLVARLGPDAVLRPQLQSEHAPERAVRLVSVVEKQERRKPAATAVGGAIGESVGGLRPLRLLARPIEIAAMSVVPDGPPVSFRLSGEQHPIAHSVGPERIETGWWRGAHARRDYHRVLTATGRGCWLFRDRGSGCWYLHGWFD
jgi:protein ImuB